MIRAGAFLGVAVDPTQGARALVAAAAEAIVAAGARGYIVLFGNINLGLWSDCPWLILF